MKNNTVNLDLKWRCFTTSFFLHSFHGNMRSVTIEGEGRLLFKDKDGHRIKYLGLYST